MTFSVNRSDLDMWLYFDKTTLSTNPNLTYPLTALAPPAKPTFVLDKSGKNATASVIGNMTFGLADDGGMMSVATLCYQGVFSIANLVAKNWTRGFTATSYFKRTIGSRYQTVLSNGMSPQSSFEIRMTPSNTTDDLSSIATFEVSSLQLLPARTVEMWLSLQLSKPAVR